MPLNGFPASIAHDLHVMDGMETVTLLLRDATNLDTVMTKDTYLVSATTDWTILALRGPASSQPAAPFGSIATIETVVFRFSISDVEHLPRLPCADDDVVDAQGHHYHVVSAEREQLGLVCRLVTQRHR